MGSNRCEIGLSENFDMVVCSVGHSSHITSNHPAEVTKLSFVLLQMQEQVV